MDQSQTSLTCPADSVRATIARLASTSCRPTVLKANGCALMRIIRGPCHRYDLAIDVTATDTYVSVRFDALMAAPGNASGSQPDYIPIVFVNNDKVSKKTNCGWHCALRFSFAGALVGLRSEGFSTVAASGSGRSSSLEYWSRLTRHSKRFGRSTSSAASLRRCT